MNLLVCYDENGSPQSHIALEKALKIISNKIKSSSSSYKLFILTIAVKHSVLDVFLNSDEINKINTQNQEAARKLLHDTVQPLCEQYQVPYEFCVELGEDTRSSIENFVNNHAIDLVIIGPRGLKGLDEVFGSTTRYLVDHLNCPILIAR